MASTKFMEPFDESDVSFNVEGKSVYAIKAVMSLWSPVFKTMFSGPYKESGANVVKLPEKRFDDILELVCVLHPPNKQIGENNYEILLPLADEYQMDGLTERIEEYLVRCQQPSIHKLFWAEKFSLPELAQQCTEFAKSSSLKTVIDSEWFEKLSSEMRAEILLSKAKQYFDMLNEVKEMVNGNRPKLANGLPANCSGVLDTCSIYVGHGIGTSCKCSQCSLYMTEILSEKLSKGSY